MMKKGEKKEFKRYSAFHKTDIWEKLFTGNKEKTVKYLKDEQLMERL